MQRERARASDDERTVGIGRREFLSSLGAIGATGAMGAAGARSGLPGRPADHVQEWPNLEDPYYASLVEDFEGMDLPPGAFVYAENEADTLAAYEVVGDAADTASIDPGDDVPFAAATRVEITGDVTNPWDVTMKGVVEDQAVEQGDVLLGVVYLRSPTAGDDDNPEVQYVAKDEEHASSNMVRNPSGPTLDTTWSRYYFTIQFDYAAEAGTWWTELFLAFGQQTVDVGGIALVDFDGDVALGQLPTWQPGYEYQGRAEDAEWRQAAHQRIQEIRTADLDVTVVDADGTPVEGATVDVTMQEHEFGFGAAITVAQLPDGDETYRETLLENFNEAVPGNGLKAPAWQGRYGNSLAPESTRAAIDWLTERGIPTRGHALVWEEYGWMGIDSDLSADEIDDLVRESIRRRASEFAGRLPEWDMHNHPIWQDDIRSDIGEDAVPGWWETASEAAPDAAMYANEMNVVAGSSYRDAYDDYLAWLLENDVDLGGIGFMGHFGINSLEPPAELLSVFDRFAEYDVPLKITEFDVELNNRNDDEQVQAQADYVRDVLTAAFSHEAVESVLSWGFWAEDHWRPTAAYWSSDWSIRPHGEEYQRLVFDEWWTEESGETDPDGNYATTGFKGEYEIRARTGERSGRTTVTLSDGGTAVDVTVDGSTPTPTGADSTESPTASGPTETGGQAGFGIIAGLAGLSGIAGYALSRERDEDD